MTEGYLIIGARMSFLFPLQGHSAPMDFLRSAAKRCDIEPILASRGLPCGIARLDTKSRSSLESAHGHSKIQDCLDRRRG
jgi:hypothetical protein